MSTRINAKGEWLYTCAELGYALGIHPNTIRAAAKRLFGPYKFEFTIAEAQKIQAYFNSLSPEQEEIRIKVLFDGLNVSNKGAKDLVRTAIDNDKS